MTKEKVLVILRGLPGSGKSYKANELITEYKAKEGEYVICSTDNFFINKETKKYEFNPKLLMKAHKWNQENAEKATKEGKPLIIIDNTMTQKWEAKPYVEFGYKQGYKIVFTEPQNDWSKNVEELAKKNVHGVPLVAIKRMKDRWETDFTVEKVLNSRRPQRSRGKWNKRGGRGRGRGRGRGGFRK